MELNVKYCDLQVFPHLLDIRYLSCIFKRILSQYSLSTILKKNPKCGENQSQYITSTRLGLIPQKNQYTSFAKPWSEYSSSAADQVGETLTAMMQCIGRWSHVVSEKRKRSGRQTEQLRQPQLSLCALACPNEGKGLERWVSLPHPARERGEREIPLALSLRFFIGPTKEKNLPLLHLPPFFIKHSLRIGWLGW